MKKIISIIILMVVCELTYSQNLPVDKIYLGTDRSIYVSGESIFLKAFYIDAASGKPADLSKIAYVELVRADRPYAQAMIELKKGGADGALQIPETVPGGTYQLRAYTNWMKNFGAETFFTKTIQVINPLMKEAPRFYKTSEAEGKVDHSFSISVDAGSTYGRRKKISIPIVSSSPSAKLYAAVSLGKSSGSIAQLHKNEVVKGLGDIKYPAETEGHLIEAYADPQYAGKEAFFSVAARPSKLYPSTVQQDGSVSFVSELIRGQHVVVAELKEEGKYVGGFKLQSPFSEEYVPFVVGDTMAVPYEDFLLSQQVGLHYGREENIVEQIISDTAMFFGKPLYSYRLDDFVRFPTMEEVLREYVIEVLVQKRREGYYFESISRDKLGIPTVMRPVILLNGVPISANAAIKLDPLKVSRIDIYNQKYFYGTSTFDGIISFHTYDNRLGELFLDAGVVPVDYSFISETRRPLFPEYRNDNQLKSRTPDFRSTLYWNSQIKLDANGRGVIEFFTSDLKGKFTVVVEGMDENGKISRVEKVIEVE